MEVHFAPMQGYTDLCYRQLHRQLYGGVDCYYSPFVRLEGGAPRRRDLAQAGLPEGDTASVPQVIFRSFCEFALLADALKGLGFRRVDLNLGCPYPMQTGRGRGAAIIGNVDEMRRVGEYIAADTDVGYSVKMRLGLCDPDEWRALLPVLDDMPLGHITVHPRVATQKYSGDLWLDSFGDMLGSTRHRVIYNGDIRTPADIRRVIDAYPALHGVMIGRGLLARPSLAEEWASGEVWTHERRLARIVELHDALLARYEATLCGQVQILQHIKPFWEYLEEEIGHRAAKAIRKSTSLPRYRSAIATLQ